MIRLIAIALALAVATSAQAMSPAPLHEPVGTITQVREGCGPFRIRVNGICVARTSIRQTRRYTAGVLDGVEAFAFRTTETGLQHSWYHTNERRTILRLSGGMDRSGRRIPTRRVLRLEMLSGTKFLDRQFPPNWLLSQCAYANRI